MGNLKPGATYVYEQANGVTYAREVGADPSTRIEIGRTVSSHDLEELHLWQKVRQAAKTNPTLQAEMDRVIMLYYLIKEEEKSIFHHSV